MYFRREIIRDLFLKISWINYCRNVFLEFLQMTLVHNIAEICSVNFAEERMFKTDLLLGLFSIYK